MCEHGEVMARMATLTKQPQNGLVGIEYAQKFLGGVSRKTVERLVERGKLKRAHAGGLRRVLFRQSDLDRLASR